MALVLDDRIKETSTTVLTADYVLLGAVAGNQSFATVGNTNTTWYHATDGTDWETGVGTYSTTGPTLARTTIISSSNSDAAVSWGAGTREITCVLPASKVYGVGYTDVAIADGGTGQGTAIAAFDALAPTTTQGDVIYHNGTDNVRLAAGTAGQVFTTGGAGANPSWATSSGGLPPGHLYGLTMSNAADTANDITIAVGSVRDESDSEDIRLTGAITKQLDATWAVGTNAGGLNTGAEANSTWYEVHLIKRTDTDVVDVMFTTTANRATLPTNYDKQRRIGWIRNDGAGAILQFTQVGDHFTLTTQVNDVNTSGTETAAAVTLTAPPSSIVRFRSSLVLADGDAGEIVSLVFSEITEGNVTPSTSTGISSLAVAAAVASVSTAASGHFELRVDASSQIEHDSSIPAGNSPTFDISTFGWIDLRGKLS